MFERLLELRRLVLPENHPDIGDGHIWSGVACAMLFLTLDFTGMSLLNISYYRGGAFSRAL